VVTKQCKNTEKGGAERFLPGKIWSWWRRKVILEGKMVYHNYIGDKNAKMLQVATKIEKRI
jgi:hypothetical protein